MKEKISVISVLLLVLISETLLAQQIPDTSYTPPIHQKMYPLGTGTTIHIDEGHNNFHTINGRYRAFSQILQSDGYQIMPNLTRFTETNFDEIKILVIANAEADGVTHPIVTPTKSAFTSDEIDVIKMWVEKGGSLFLIADHMPFAGAAAGLANAFGFKFYDSFVMYDAGNSFFDFSIDDGSLSNHSISRGRNEDEMVQNIRSFTGQGFKIPSGAESILNLNETQTVFLTDTMWVFKNIKTFPATGLSQGAIMRYGKGKLVIWGEAAMFSAQLAGPNRYKAGMNTPEAAQNYKLLLNLIHWLDNKL